jgi:hypothetical protein
MRLFRTLALVELGAWMGLVGATLILKRVLRSRGDESSDEVALAAVLDGVTLKSRAQAFRGGSMLAWLGGVAVDLREASLAPEATIVAHSVLGGVAIRVPAGWRVESSAKAIAGGVAIDAPEPDDPAAPTLKIEGFSLLGGIAVGAKAAEPAFESQPA